jgi:hypothetical protein
VAINIIFLLFLVAEIILTYRTIKTVIHHQAESFFLMMPSEDDPQQSSEQYTTPLIYGTDELEKKSMISTVPPQYHPSMARLRQSRVV